MTFAVARLADYPSATGQALRYGIAALALSTLRRARVRLPSLQEGVRLALLAAAGLAAFNAFLIAAVRESDPASVGVVVGCLPIVLVVAAALGARRPIDRRLVAGAVIVAAGAAAVQGFGGELTAAGVGYSLGALAFSLLAAPLLGRLGVVAVSFWAAALAVPLLLTAALLSDGPSLGARAPSGAELAALGYLGLVVTAGAFCLWYAAIQCLGVERAGLFSGIVPLAALLAAAALGQSALTSARALGAAAVAGGIALGLSGTPHPAARLSSGVRAP